jgi:hypothetical protein
MSAFGIVVSALGIVVSALGIVVAAFGKVNPSTRTVPSRAVAVGRVYRALGCPESILASHSHLVG